MAEPSRSSCRDKSSFNVLATSLGMLFLSILVFYCLLNHDLNSSSLTTFMYNSNDHQQQIAKSDNHQQQPEKEKQPKTKTATADVQTTTIKTTQRKSELSSAVDNEKQDRFLQLLKNHSTIHQFNRHMLLPLIKSIVTMDYFRYVKVNLNRPCKLWCDSDKCNMRDCKVKPLSDPSKCPVSNYDNDELSVVNTELASDQLNLLTKLFECNDNDDQDSQYVDLLINPERYTGYSGEHAHRIWRAIYEENCFVRPRSRSPFNDQDMCYEERLFYEAISGLHSSINIHLCAEYPSNAMIGTFEPNLNEFLRRFEDHTDYLENLYTLFLLELRALEASKVVLSNRVNWPDQSTKNAVQDLLSVVDKFDIPMFEDLSLKPSHVSHELAIHFRNITTTIIDCVACDKCKLWGKVQLRGLGTAFKVLSVKDMGTLHLNHQEVVTLINAIARLSHSIRQLEEFRELLLRFKESGYNNINGNKNQDCRNSHVNGLFI